MFKEVINNWFLGEPLLFELTCNHKFETDDKLEIPIRTGHGVIKYNPTIIGAKSEVEKEKLLKLECLRILLKHPYSRQPLNSDPQILIAASDIAISEYVRGLPKGTLSIKDFKPNFPPKLIFEDYYSLLVPRKEEIAQAIQGMDGMSDEEKEMAQKILEGAAAEWDEDQDMEEKVNQMIKKAEGNPKVWGSLRGGLQDAIIASTQVKINIKKHLENFRTSILSMGRVLTRMRPSRRYGFQQMGSKHPYTTRLLLGIDVSGSVCDHSLSNFFGAINQFFRQGIETLDVMQFDHGLQPPLMNMKKAMKTPISINGRGGTEFQSIVDYAAENNYDGLIIFTDGYASHPEIPKGLKVLWVLESREAYNDFQLTPKIYIP